MAMTDVGGLPVIQTGGGFGGDSGWLGMLLVIALLGGGNGGGLFGGGNATNAANMGQITNDFLYSALNNNMGQGFSNLQNSFDYTNLNNSLQNQTAKMVDGFNGVNGNVTNLGFQTLLGQKDVQSTIQSGFAAAQAQNAQCCCDNLRAIDGVNFNMANNTAAVTNAVNNGFCQTNFNGERNTNAIIQNATANTQRIIDWMTCNELKEANAEIARQNQALSEARIIAAMKPAAPIPAYLAANPYTGYGFPNGAPFGVPFNGCGCTCA